MNPRPNISSAKIARDLVYTTHHVADTVSIREIRAWFQSQPNVRSLGVILDNGSFAIVTREKLFNGLISESIPLNAPLCEHAEILSKAYTVDAQTPIQDMVETLIAARGQENDFFDDIILQSQNKLIGLVSVRDAVVDFFENLMHRLTAMEAQQSALARQNKELFENSFRQGQRETQFRSFFERAPVPVVVFDKMGSFVSASRRFYVLAGYTPKQIDATFYFQRLFADEFTKINQPLMDDAEENPIKILTLIPSNKATINVSVVIDYSDWGHVLVSILGFAEKSILAAPEMLAATTTKTSSRITQAIRAKMQEQKAKGLARSVASNLIDREEQVERLMKKLEKIFEVADQVEEVQIQSPASTHEPVAEESQRLKGDLTEFSVIDLCQILIQGTKTGKLLIRRHTEDEPVACIYFYCGGIVHAEHLPSSMVGIDALAHVLKIREGSFDFVFHQSAPQTTISGDPMGILMDACRKADEAGK
ncbi:MAG: DUF4388 domain-containing protein [Verrucomicrobiota bacterium]